MLAALWNFADPSLGGGPLEPPPTPQLLAAACGFACRRLLQMLLGSRSRDPSEPPEVPGSLLLGNAAQFGADAVQFLLGCRRQFGDLFSIRFPGHRIHVLMDPRRVGDFGRVKELDFGPIHEQVTRNVFGFQMPSAHRMLREAAKSARTALKEDVGRYQLLVDEGLEGRMAGLRPGEWHSEMLDDFLGDTQFRAIFNGIFGRSDGCEFNHASARRLFADIHASFNYVWLGLPTWLFPRTWAAWRQVRRAHPTAEELLARGDCSAYVRCVMRTMMESGEPQSSIIGHNMVYLHVNYNTKKATYWAFNYLLRHADALAALRAEVDEAIADRAGDPASMVEFSTEEIDRLPLIDSFVKETLRLASGVFVIRQVTADTSLEVGGRQYLLRRGDKAAIYPPALHRDPEMFDCPTEFRYDRFVRGSVEFRGKPISRPILPYGLLCPGQRLSLIQIKWFLFASLARLELRRDGELAEFDFGSYGHEILPPKRDVSFSYAARPNRWKLQLN